MTDSSRHVTAVRVYAVGIAVVGLFLLGVLFRHDSFIDVALTPTFWFFVAAIVVAELRPIVLESRNARIDWTFSTPFMFALLLYKGPAIAALVSLLASSLSDLASRRPWDRTLFNAGQYVITIASAGAMLSLFDYSRGALVATPFDLVVLASTVPAALAYLLLNFVLVATAIALQQHLSVLTVLREGARVQLTSHLVMLGAAPVVAVLAGQSLLLVFLLLLPVIGAHRAAKLTAEKEQQASHDALTGLANRGLFRSHIEWAVGTASPTVGPAVVLLDLDQFKDVNDSLGHQAGDQLLQLVAARLTEFLDDEIVVARLGGDEFAVLLPGVTDPDEAVEAAVGIQAILRKPLSVEGFSLDVSASAGIASYPEHGRDADTLLRRAEVAMYVAKDKHGGVEVYRHEREEHSRRRLSLVHDLRKAVEDGELGVSYQPKADLRTGEIVSMEALVRWTHPEHGPVSPEEFIPLAERTGLIAPLTAQVLRMALDECARWHQARFALGVAVNLSPAAMFDRGLQRTASELISMWELAPGWLELEITESTIMADPDQARRVLNNAADIGVRLSIDDFGTGYSSLGLLKQLPVHELKVDRSFVQNIVHDASDAAIVRTTVQLARSLGMTVCAEGVETEAAWQSLVELECDLAQGYLLGRPIPGPDVMAWLLARIPGPQTWAPTAGPVPEQQPIQAPAGVTFIPRRRVT